MAAYADGPVRLKTRLLDSNSAGPPITGRHFIVQFGHYPAAETRSALEGRGMRVLGYVPDFALMVSADNPPDLDGLDVTWKGSLAAGDKLSPELSTGPRNAFLVMMQADVSRAAARELLLSRGFFLLDQPGLLPAHYVVLGSYRALYELAASDEVAYILPPSPDLLSGQPVMACAGPLTEAGPIGQYVTVGSGWVKDSTGSVNLNYAFESLNARLDSNTQQSEILRALAQWAAYANIRLSAGTGSGARTVDIKFASGSHGDAYPFYPSGTVLAHTFYPVPLNPEPIAGDMHLNADENWKIGATLDVFSVALHEAGHALGLGHTDKPDSVMYPYYHLVTALSADDIAGVQALYGSKAPVGPPTPPPTPSPSPAPTPEPSPTPTPGPPDQTPPSLAITSPGSSIVSTYTDSITVSGTASDNVGVTAVRWSTSNGFSGTANGTNTWSAMVPLLVGNNVITVRAYDAAGNSGWRALTVVRH